MEDKKLIIKPKTAKGEDGYKVFSIRVKEEIVCSIDDISNRTNRSRNELISMMLQFAIDHCVIDAKSTNSDRQSAFPQRSLFFGHLAV